MKKHHHHLPHRSKPPSAHGGRATRRQTEPRDLSRAHHGHGCTRPAPRNADSKFKRTASSSAGLHVVVRRTAPSSIAHSSRPLF
jgi:hypothetical protein